MIHNKLSMLIATVALLLGCQSNQNQSPNVQAGPDKMVDAGENVALHGSATDVDGTVRTYRWEQVEGPSVSLSNSDQASAYFVAPKVKGSEVLIFRLTAVDDQDSTATDEVVIITMEPNQPPNAQAGPDQTVARGDKVRLRGSALDLDGTIQTYRWEQVDGPSVLLSNADQASASFVAQKPPQARRC